MKKEFITILLMAFIGANFLKAQWSVVGNADFTTAYASSTSIAFDSSGVPYVAFGDGSHASKASVMTLKGNTWELAGNAGFSTGAAQYLVMAVSHGTPLVGYSNAGNGSKATVMELNSSGTWVSIGNAGFSAGAAYYSSLALDSLGIPYMAYCDPTSSNGVTVMRAGESGWANLGNPGFSPGQANYVSIAIKGVTPYVAFSDATQGGSITVMSYNGSTWSIIGSAGFGGEVESTSIAIDNTGAPYVAAPVTPSGDIFVYKLEGTTWTPLNGGGPSGAVSAGAGLAPQIAIDGNNTSYVIYQDLANGYLATLMKYTGAIWEAVGGAGFTPSKALDISLAIGPDNAPYAAFVDYGDTNKITVMKYPSTSTGVGTEEKNTISLYPNPVKDGFFVNSPSPIITLTIYDLKGRMVMTDNRPDSNCFDMSNFTNGLYLVEIKTTGGVFREKIMKD